MERYRDWIILNSLPGIGAVCVRNLLERFASPSHILNASREELAAVEGVGKMTIETIQDWRNLLPDVDQELHLVEKHGVSLVCLSDAEYPANLKVSGLAPPLLYYRGAFEPIDKAAVGVIGSRKISRYGRDATHRIVSDLAQAGVTIVSGLAIGVDGAAHQFALDAGGRTLAVLGTPLNRIYPARHKVLAEEVVKHGALISQFPMSWEGSSGDFPARNAVIAGLSLGLVVIESGKQSGTSITVGYALDANRSVFAVPGDITRVNSMGTNRLIQEGGRLVTCGNDILQDLREEMRGLIEDLPELDDPEEGAPRPLPKDLSDTERLLMEVLALDPTSIDALTDSLSDKAVISRGDMMTGLLNLELKGLIRQEPGMKFRRLR